MAIRFRCPHCQTLQSIAHRKAGLVVKCAACEDDVLVPMADEGAATTAPPADKPADQISVRDEIAELDRVALPDEFFDIDDDEAPAVAPLVSAEQVAKSQPVNESLKFTAADEPDANMAAVAAEVELPPVRSRGEEMPEQFQLSIRKSKIDDEMDLTPMVDVVFQLLIFFMVTASFALHKTIETPSPDPDQKGATQSIQTLDELEGVAILVRIDGQNGILIDDEPLADDSRVVDALRDKMRAEQKSEVIITADAAAWHRTVVKVVDAANEVGMQKIRLATRSGPVD